jgi:tRNA pseudouridine55 synthase
MARAGETVELRPRTVTIHELTLTDWDDSDAQRPIAVLDVDCSAGTYVRALARDLGERVGSAAYLGALRRTAAGAFGVADALSLDAIREAANLPDGLAPLLKPIDTGLDRFPEVALSPDEVDAVARGQFIRPSAGFAPGADRYRLRAPDGVLVALAIPIDGGRLAPDKVLVSPTASAAVAG